MSSRKTNVSVSGDFSWDLPSVVSAHLSDFCYYTNFCCSVTFDKGMRRGLLHHPENRYGLVPVHLSQHPPADPHSAMPSVILYDPNVALFASSHFDSHGLTNTSLYVSLMFHLCLSITLLYLWRSSGLLSHGGRLMAARQDLDNLMDCCKML